MGSDEDDFGSQQYTQTEGTQTQFEPQSNDDELLYTVKCIVAEGIIKKKKMYKVQWEGTDEDGKPWEDSWIPRRDITDDVVNEWKRKQKEKVKAKSSRKSSTKSTAKSKRSSTSTKPADKRKAKAVAVISDVEEEEAQSPSRSYTPSASLEDNEPGPSALPAAKKKLSQIKPKAKRKRSPSVDEIEGPKPRKKIRPPSPSPLPAATLPVRSPTPPVLDETNSDIENAEARDIAESLTQEAKDGPGQESSRSLPSPPLSSPSPPDPQTPQKHPPERGQEEMFRKPVLSPRALRTLELFDDFLLSIDKEAVIPSTQSQDDDIPVERPIRPQSKPGRSRSKREERELAEVVPETDLSQSQSQPVDSSQSQPNNSPQAILRTRNDLIQPIDLEREPIILAPDSSQPKSNPPSKPKTLTKAKVLRALRHASPSHFRSHLSSRPSDAENEVDEIEDFSGELHEKHQEAIQSALQRKAAQRPMEEKRKLDDILASRQTVQVRQQSSVIGNFTQSFLESIEHQSSSPFRPRNGAPSQEIVKDASSSQEAIVDVLMEVVQEHMDEQIQDDHSKTDTDPPTQPDVSGDVGQVQIHVQRFEEEESTQDLLEEQRLLTITSPRASPIPELEERSISQADPGPSGDSPLPVVEAPVPEPSLPETSHQGQARDASPSAPAALTKSASFGPAVHFLHTRAPSQPGSSQSQPSQQRSIPSQQPSVPSQHPPTQSPPALKTREPQSQSNAQLQEQIARLEREISSTTAENETFAALVQQTEARVQANLAAIEEARATIEATEARTAALVADIRREYGERIAKMEKDLESWKRMAEWSIRMEQNANDGLRFQAGELEHQQAREAELQDELASWTHRLDYERTTWEEKHKREREEWYAQRPKPKRGTDDVHFCSWRNEDSSCGQVFENRPTYRAHVKGHTDYAIAQSGVS